MANWANCPTVERVAGKAGELWVFKGTQVPLYAMYETLASGGVTVDDFAERCDVDVEQVVATLQYEADELHDYRLDYTGRVPYARNPDTDRVGPDDAMWRACPLVEQAAGRLGGAWVFKNSRLALYVLHANLASGATIDEFVKWYEGVEKWQVKAVLEHAAKELREDLPAYADTL